MKTNAASAKPKVTTYEGGTAVVQRPLLELERAVATCLLWENTFYEKGSEIGERIADLCKQVKPEEIAALAIKARTDLKLRHVPLWLCVQLLTRKAGKLASETITAVCQRPDEMGELLSLYWKEGKKPLAAQLKKGLAAAFQKFGFYGLAKWNKDGPIKLRDVLFLCHAKPKDAEQDALWKKLIDGTLETPDTWEVALSAGKDKKETWERLLKEKKLGDMALLMNVRNMAEAKVDPALVESAILEQAGKSKALPFRYVSAAKAAPQYAAALSDAMLKAVSGKLEGSTAVVIDVSGSMDATISARSELSRWEAASALAILIREIGESVRVFTFSNRMVEIPNYRGLPLLNGVGQSQPHGGTELNASLAALQKHWQPDRVVVITDEQSHDGIYRAWTKHAYLINVAPYKPGLDMSQGWHRISGWSERVVDWMQLQETSNVSD